jgi:hypothetical protein
MDPYYASSLPEMYLMRVPEDGPLFGPKLVATLNKTKVSRSICLFFIYRCVDGQIPSIMMHNRMQK